MKQVIFPLLLCVTLTACESVPTMSDVSNFKWSSLNPFGENREPVQEVSFDEVDDNNSNSNAPLSAPQSGSALQTELTEIEMLTGSRPKIVRDNMDKTQMAAVADNNNEAIQKTIDPVFEEPVINQQEADFNKGDEGETAAAVTPSEKPTRMAAAQPMPQTQSQPGDFQASISEGPAAPAAPQESVKSQPTIDSIKWNGPAQRPTQQAKAQQAPARKQQQQATTRPEQAAIPEQPSSVQSLAITKALNKQSLAKGCPQLQIMPEARSITYFENEMGGKMTARAAISDVRGGCEVVDGGMEIDLKIIMKGQITNQGRFEGNRNLEAFITFPYFVSVAKPDGTPQNKEIKATAMRFRPMVDTLDHAAELTRFIPMNDVRQADRYTVIVGYQLTRKQLEYNRAETMMRTNNNRISRDVAPARKRSINPLADE